MIKTLVGFLQMENGCPRSLWGEGKLLLLKSNLNSAVWGWGEISDGKELEGFGCSLYLGKRV
ncbi:unnamed protein product, partial [Vitis vinifera]|uniref:Uncharacterized protein n=1 Tax=Vitis vinifera TaxID=29760 RepID=D7SRC1_VITVI